MALGLSVIFGVVRVVNFAHGGMMTIAMYAATVLFAALGLDPFVAMLPIAAAFFVFGYLLQAGLINPFITRPEHSQFMLLVAVAIIMVNAMLMIFGPDARHVPVGYQREACVAVAGCAMVLLVEVTPSLGPAYTLLAFVIVIVGGLGSMGGALLGGVLIGVSEALAGLFIAPSAKSMFSFGLLILVLLLRPQGLLGRRS